MGRKDPRRAPGRRGVVVLAVAAISIAGAVLVRAQSEPDATETPPRDIGLAERAGRRLAQLDITVIGPAESIASLTAEDFTIRINLRKLRQFQIDRLCPAAGPPVEPSPEVERALAPAPQASYLFYFDQPLLTMAGRRRSIDVARELVERLVRDDVQAMIVSNARETVVVQRLTRDADLLRAKLDELVQDRLQWDMYAHQEEQRVEDVVRTLNENNNLSGAMARARLYQKEEYWFMQRSLRRLAITLGQLVDLDAPKALIYFADTVRSNPGEHYLSFFGDITRSSQPVLSPITGDALMGGLAFDAVVNSAAGQGIRIYTVEARGLTADMDTVLANPAAMNQTRVVPSSSRVRSGDTHRALQNLAAETGGRAFLHGVRPARIAERILADSSCVYLASFDPSGFSKDAPLSVSVKIDRPDIELRVRGRIVLESDGARATSELLRAFSSPESIADPFEMQAGLVPTGFDNGAYTALLQIHVPGSPAHGAVWDVGASLVADSRVREKASGRVSPAGRDVPVILEQEWRFKPGDYELVAVAQEARSGLVASTRVVLDWPALTKGDDAAVGPIALLRPTNAAFLRAGRTRTTGSMLVPEGAPLRTSDPAAFVALVCRGKQAGPVRVVRRLVGETTHEFPDLEIADEEQPCAQIRDVVPSNILRPGYYRYDVLVTAPGNDAASGARDFVVLASESPPVPGP